MHKQLHVHCMCLPLYTRRTYKKKRKKHAFTASKVDTTALTAKILCMHVYTCVPVVVGASAHRVVAVALLSGLLCPKVLERVRPEQVTHGAKCRGLLEPVQLICACVHCISVESTYTSTCTYVHRTDNKTTAYTCTCMLQREITHTP